jgi:hypothetical protein
MTKIKSNFVLFFFELNFLKTYKRNFSIQIGFNVAFLTSVVCIYLAGSLSLKLELFCGLEPVIDMLFSRP